MMLNTSKSSEWFILTLFDEKYMIRNLLLLPCIEQSAGFD